MSNRWRREREAMERHRHRRRAADATRQLPEEPQSFNSRCYLATSVILGCRRPRLPCHGALVRRCLGGWRAGYEDGSMHLRNSLRTLDAIADLIRLTRNQIGQPTRRQIDADTARIHLTIAPMYLHKTHALAVHFVGLLARAGA